MPTTAPVLTLRIPTHPWGDPAKRRTIGFDEYVKTGGYKALDKALDMPTASIVDEVKQSQIRGRGGAGFPCGMKWSFLPPPDGGRRYLAVNCDEAEPGTFKDRLLVDFDPHLVLEGIAIACFACQLDTAYFFIRGEYHHQAHVVEHAIKEAYDNGISAHKRRKMARDYPENEGLAKQKASEAIHAAEGVDGGTLDAAAEAAQRGRTA